MNKSTLYLLISSVLVVAFLVFAWLLAPEQQSGKIVKHTLSKSSHSSPKLQTEYTATIDSGSDAIKASSPVANTQQAARAQLETQFSDEHWRSFAANTMRQSIENMLQTQAVNGWLDDIICKADTCIASIKLSNHDNLSLAADRLIRELDNQNWNDETYVNVNSMQKLGDLGELKIEVARFPQ